jgi:hypothetical protein
MNPVPDQFKFEVVSAGNKKTIVLKGIINEDTLFSPITKVGAPYILNFKNITSINSCGIRSWVNFLKELGAHEVFYEECPPVIVRQMNMVPSFVGKAKVLSVFVPYVCDACEKEHLELLSDKDFKASDLKETFPCPYCQKGEMELDGSPEQYFAFAK